MQSLRIGISIGLMHNNESMWTNGIKQNALFLAKVLMASESGHEVILLNTTDHAVGNPEDKIDLVNKLSWDPVQFPTQNFMQFLETDGKLDVFIELGGQISVENMLRLKEKGAKCISYCCGVEYLYLVEKMVNNIACWPQGLLVNRNFDAIWCVPQVAEHSAPFLGTLRRAPARAVPFVWDPMFIEQRAAEFEGGGLYRPSGRQGKRIAIMEPNQNVVKTCIFPIMITELVHRQTPELIEMMNVVNGIHWAKHSSDFNQLMSHMDLVRDHKAVFIERHDTAAFLALHTDVVVSHQINNPLNYFYFDVSWLGYPLVHNAYKCEELGYFYSESDVDMGAKKLAHAIKTHDGRFDAYREEQRMQLLRYTSQNRRLVRQYDELLSELVNQ